jgi:Glycosyl transferase family 2
VTTPAISVVVAAYGRPGVLVHALRSVQAQTIDDWEALVVGDAAGDETASVVAATCDPRIRFVDLPVNIGEQSGPNNVGVRRTAAPLVAFLNQDDLWFPDHLEVALATLEARCADLVFSPNINVLPGGDLAATQPTVIIDGLSRHGRYDPTNIDGAYPASAWLVRRETLDTLRGWRAAQETTLEPSQDLLARAHRRGMRLWSTGVATMISLPSGTRLGSYVDGAVHEHEWFAARLSDPSFRALLLARDPRTTTDAALRDAVGRSTKSKVWRRGLRLVPRHGPPPKVIHRAVADRWRRGERIEALRAIRGLSRSLPHGDRPDELRRAEALRRCTIEPGVDVVTSTQGGGARHLVAGWSAPEAEFTWNDSSTAVLAVRRADDTGDIGDERSTTLWLTFVALVDDRMPRQRIDVSVDQQPAVSWQVDHADELTMPVPLGPLGTRPRLVQLDLPDAAPHPSDPRRLALRLLRLRVDIDD